MYIVILSRGIPSEKYKKHGIFEFDQAKALVQLGCKVVFAVVDIRSLRCWRKWGVERYDREGIHVFRINIPGGRLLRCMQNGLIKLGLRILYPIIEKEFGIPDILHAHFTSLGYAAACLKEQFSIQLVVTEHSSMILKDPINKKIYLMAKKTYTMADRLIAVSPALAEVIWKIFGIKAEYIPNVVETALFSFYPKRIGTDFCFISVGNLIDSKRMDLTITAFAEAFDGISEVSLYIFGEGPERARLKGIIKVLGQEGKIFLMGSQPRSVIAEKMKSCHCFVLPSHHETFGVVYVEALASGLPVIATWCGGPEHFVHEGNGLVIPVDDKQALVEAMRYMFHNASGFDCSKISSEAKKLFSPETVGRQLTELYSRLIK